MSGLLEGARGPRTLLFLKELGKRVRAQTGEARSADYLLQRLSAAVQRGNAISIMSGLLEGARGPRTLLFLKELGKRVRAQTGEARSADYLLQRLSAAVQRGNAISIMSGLLEGACDTIT